MKDLFKNLTAKAKSGGFRFRADVDKADLIDGETGSKTGGLKVMTVVLFVLVVHIVAIGGYTAYSSLTKKEAAQAAVPVDATTPDADKPAVATDGDAAPKGDVAQADATKDASTPAVDSNAPAPASEAMTLDAAPSENAPTQAAAPTPAPVQASAPAPAPAPVTAASASTGVKQDYVVKSGDNLHKIALAHGMTVVALKSLNGLKTDAIRVGQKLAVVAKGSAPAIAAPALAPAPALAAAPAAPAASGRTYKVAKGDTLTRIAKQFNTSAAALMAVNKLADPKKLKIGEVLMIPGGAARQISSQQVAPTPAPSQAQANPDLVMNK